MTKLDIILLESANGVKFGSDAEAVHKAFGDNFKNYKDKKLTDSDNEFLMKVAEKMSEISGKPVSNYTKYLTEETEFDNDPCDYYPFCMIDYDDNDKFNAISVYADEKTKLFVDGKEYNFDFATLLTLADDFVEEENKTTYISHSKQISIWCPDGDKRVESILFGCPGYWDSLN